jgi:hypothetical protein
MPPADEEGLAPLLDLLALVPLQVSNPVGGQGLLWEYANMAAQFAAVGVDPYNAGADVVDQIALDATFALSHGPTYRMATIQGTSVESLGFDPWRMSQALMAGDSFGQMTLFHGEFDRDRLISAWEAAGYTAVRTPDGHDIWTIGSMGELQGEHPVQRALFSAMNNVTIIGDTLIFTPLQETLQSVFDIEGSSAATALDDPATMGLLHTLPASTVSAIALRTDAIDYPSYSSEEVIEAELAPLRDEFGPMPALQGMISTVNAGALPLRDERESGADLVNAGTACFRIQYESNAAATQAATVFAQRWEELESPIIGERYEALMSLDAIKVDGHVVSADLTQYEYPGLWNELFRNGDILALLPDA